MAACLCFHLGGGGSSTSSVFIRGQARASWTRGRQRLPVRCQAVTGLRRLRMGTGSAIAAGALATLFSVFGSGRDLSRTYRPCLDRGVLRSEVVMVEPPSAEATARSVGRGGAVSLLKQPAASGRSSSQLAFLDAGSLQYRIETYLTWNPPLKTLFLLGTLVAIFVAGGYLYNKSTDFDAGQAYWRTWCALSGAEPDFSEDPWQAKALVIVMTVVQLFFFAFLLSLVEQAVSSKMEELSAGRTMVYESGHEVILGWNPAVPMVLKQLAIANETNRESQTVVILADREKSEMDRIVREQIGSKFKSLRVLCRHGDPSQQDDQNLVAIKNASRVIILSSKRGDDDGDQDQIQPSIADNVVFKTALTLKDRISPRTRTILETYHTKTEALLPYLGRNTTKLNWGDLVTKLLVQSTAEGSGFSEVQREILRFEGSEWYVQKFPELVGQTFDAAARRFQGGTLAGIQSPDSDTGAFTVTLNPEGSQPIRERDQLIFLARNKRIKIVDPPAVDPDRVVPTTSSDLAARRTVSRPSAPKGPVLVLGWRKGMSSVLAALDRHYAPGTQVRVIASAPKKHRLATLNPNLRLHHIRVTHVEGDMCDPSLLTAELTAKTPPQSGLVLLDESEGARTVVEREAQVLTSLVALKAARQATGWHHLSLAAELETEGSAEVAQREGVGASTMVLDEFSACFLAQAAYNPDVLPVHRSLLSPHGADLSFREPEHYFGAPSPTEGEAKISSAATFNLLSVRAREQGDLLLGFIPADSDEAVLSIPADTVVDPTSVKKFVVLTPPR